MSLHSTVNTSVSGNSPKLDDFPLPPADVFRAALGFEYEKKQ